MRATDREKLQAAEYLETQFPELIEMTEAAGLEVLTYILKMAAVEAAAVVDELSPPKTRPRRTMTGPALVDT